MKRATEDDETTKTEENTDNMYTQGNQGDRTEQNLINKTKEAKLDI